MYIVIYKDNKIKNIISSNKDTEQVIKDLKLKNFILDDDKYKVFEKIQNMSVTDIRAIKEDGSVMSLEEQIENKILVLEKAEEIRNGGIYKLNKNIQEDFIRLVELGLEELDDKQKIVTSDDGRKYITQKSYEELFKENLITTEEYNNYIISQRQSQYMYNLDGERAELVESVLNNLASQGLLTEEQKSQLESLQTKRQEIKTEYPKEN
ncbi:phage tail protein [Brachyspira sp. G79]|uniref:phage tail protein n=1 Tax=Brachyspira sp. G79 TaxID=1358104 RepID=UPI000BBCC33F|nr:phage tail protein [Brachyspira sp. G79]PCG20574.1 Hvp 28 VSH-1 tail protein [Brachyspira sp. G79]